MPNVDTSSWGSLVLRILTRKLIALLGRTSQSLETSNRIKLGPLINRTFISKYYTHSHAAIVKGSTKLWNVLRSKKLTVYQRVERVNSDTVIPKLFTMEPGSGDSLGNVWISKWQYNYASTTVTNSHVCLKNRTVFLATALIKVQTNYQWD